MFEEILLEKLASGYYEDDLEMLAEEAAYEAEMLKEAGDYYEEEEYLSDYMDDDDVEKLASMLDDDELEELVEEIEAEKTAAAYYELGQIMAAGFSDEMDKEAAQKMRVLKKFKKHVVDPAAAAARRASESMASSGRRAVTKKKHTSNLPAVRPGTAERIKSQFTGLGGAMNKARLTALLEDLKAAPVATAKRIGTQAVGRVMRYVPGLHGSNVRKALRQGLHKRRDAVGRAVREDAFKGKMRTLGAGATLAGGTAAYQMGKRSGDAEVYEALAVLDEYGLLDE